MLFIHAKIPTTIEEVEKAELVNALEDAIELLLQTYITLHRGSWEEGLTESEIGDRLCDYLWNAGLQPGLPEHRENVEAFLRERAELKRGLARLRRPETIQMLKARLNGD